MSEPERAGAETGDRSARHERRVVDLGAVKRLQPVAGRIVERNQAADAPRIGQRLRFGRDSDAGCSSRAASASSAARVGDLPAEEARAFAHRAVDHDALLAVVHPERQQRIAALDRLQPDQAGAELPPVVEVVRAETGISQTQQCHRLPPSVAIFARSNAPLLAQILRKFSAFRHPKDGPARPAESRPVPPLTSPPADGD